MPRAAYVSTIFPSRERMINGGFLVVMKRHQGSSSTNIQGQRGGQAATSVLTGQCGR